MTARLELVNLSEAARRTRVPRRTIGGWVTRDLLHPAGLSETGTPLYHLAKIRELAAATPRRRTKPQRNTRKETP